MTSEKFMRKQNQINSDIDYAISIGHKTVKSINIYTSYGQHRIRQYLQAKYPELLQTRAKGHTFSIGNTKDSFYESEHALALAIIDQIRKERAMMYSLTTIKRRIKQAIIKYERTNKPVDIIVINEASDNPCPIILYACTENE